MENAANRMGTEKVSKLIFSLGIPAVVAQLINVLYNIVDRIYIGNIAEIGTLALTGVGVTLPIIMIISAFSAFAGMGGAPLASIKLGEGDNNGAEKIMGNSFSLLLLLSVVLTVFFLCFKQPLLYAFGASDNIIGYANEYISIYVIGTVFVQLALGLNTFISAQGHAKVAMYSVLIGAVANIVLDPIFIFTFGMGVKGAAIATVISQALSAFFILWYLTGKKAVMRIRIKNMKLDGKIVGRTAALGISPFIMQATESIVAIAFNSGLQSYGGDLHVGAMTILNSIKQFVTMPINGFCQGAQPIMSYNYGAKNYDRVRQTFKILIIITVSLTTAWCILLNLIPALLARPFAADQQLIDLTAGVIPIFFAGVWAFGAQMACQSTFLALGQAKTSLFLALTRKIFLLVPFILIFPRVWGVNGIYAAEPVADIVAAAITFGLFLRLRHDLMPNVQKK